jgi:hypothetical protein
MIRFWCECGRQLQARGDDIGRLAACPICGKTTTVPDSDQPRADLRTRSPGPAAEHGDITREPLRQTPRPAPRDEERPVVQPTSWLATAALVFGVLSFPCGFGVFMSLPAIITGILALRKISRIAGELRGRGSAIAGLVLGCLGLLLVPALYLAVEGMREAVNGVRVNTERMTSASNLKQIAFAMRNYHSSYNFMPAATAYYTRDGRPGLSWRVAMLPFIEEDRLFKEFHLDEPWDSPHNILLLDRMPKMYRLPGEPNGTVTTHTQVFVGPGTPFEPQQGPKRSWQPGPVLAEAGPRIPASFPKGTSTILIATARNPVPWTKPEDIPYDPDRPLPPLGGHPRRGFHIAQANGSVTWISGQTSESALRPMITSKGERAKGEGER